MDRDEPLTPGADPASLEAERAVLGAILLHDSALADTGELTPAHFFREPHQRLFRHILELAADQSPIDATTLRISLARTGELETVGGIAYVASLLDGVPRGTHVKHYVSLIQERARARQVVRLARGAIETFSADPRALSNGAGTRFLDAFRREVEAAHDGELPDGGVSESLDEFFASAPEPAPPIIHGLMPGSGIVLPHGHPRARKSLAVIHMLLSAACGQPPFGLERLGVAEPVACWYITDEDSAAEVKTRIAAQLAGAGLTERPPRFRVSAHKGVWLPDPAWQDRILREVERQSVRCVAFDPIRAVSDQVDKGPGELSPLTGFLRRLMRETGVVIVLLHHDTKPSRDGKPDDRPRAQRASGGGIFSISDAPIHVERVSDDVSLLVPNNWKHAADPPAVKVRFQFGDGWARLTGEDVEAHAALELALHEQLLAALAEHGGYATSKLATTIRRRKDDVMGALEQLLAAGKVDSVKAGQATRWFLKGAQS